MAWKNRVAVVQTPGAPPIIGVTILVRRGCMRKSNPADSNIDKVNRTGVIIRACTLFLSRRSLGDLFGNPFIVLVSILKSDLHFYVDKFY
jgi:hypothetical protein